MDPNPTSAPIPSAADGNGTHTTPLPKSPQALFPFDTFHPFTRLPNEIQVQIWTLVPIAARVVTLRFTPDPRPRHPPYALCSSPVPALLHTCSLSRQVALQTYGLAFASAGHRPIYFAAAHDTVCLDGLPADWAVATVRPDDALGISPADLAAVRHVVVSDASPLGARWVGTGIETQLRGMTGLRSVGLVYEDLRHGHALRVRRALVGLRGRLRQVVGVTIVGDGVLGLRFWWREELEAWQRGEQWKGVGDEVGLDDGLVALVKRIRALNL